MHLHECMLGSSLANWYTDEKKWLCDDCNTFAKAPAEDLLLAEVLPAKMQDAIEEGTAGTESNDHEPCDVERVSGARGHGGLGVLVEK